MLCMPSKSALKSKALPITLSEFRESLESLWMLAASRTSTARFGLAVSGGVDSMALAGLCAELRASDIRFPSFKAYIVNHKARSGSEQEAQAVKYNLKALGIESRVLHVEWPKNVNPRYLTDFETQARRLRYRAIGRAAYEDQITSILLAHHSDDQAETVLMRLAVQRRPKALLEAVRDIPECFGMYGVSKSGSPIRQYTENNIKFDSSMDFEGGGVKLLRPLLQFRKNRLEATCQHKNIEWFHDYTNDDRSLTFRNASRYLLSSNTLPLALQRENLLYLQSHVTEENAQQELRIDVLFAKLKLNLMVRSGVVRVALPKLFSTFYHGQEIPSMDTMRYEGAMLLKRIANLVTPCPSIDLRTLGSNLGCVFSDLDVAEARSREHGKASTTFTADGVIFYEDERPMLGKVFRSPLKGAYETIWVLARQPFNRGQPLPSNATIEFPTSKNHNDDIESSVVYQKQNDLSPFQLWDGRYWIRAKNRTKAPVVCRPLTEKDILRVNSALQGNSFPRTLMRRVAPGPLKFVLPVLADAEGKVHQLPSLFINLSEECKDGLIKTEIRYKNVELGSHNLCRPSTYKC